MPAHMMSTHFGSVHGGVELASALFAVRRGRVLTTQLERLHRYAISLTLISESFTVSGSNWFCQLG
jgi:hypothetical protein